MSDKTEKIHEMVEEINRQMMQAWNDNILFSWRWWLGIFLSILPWALWIVFRKKESTHRLLYSGTWIIIISSYLDFIGVCFGAWHYHWKVMPLIISYMPWDFSLIPVVMMFFLQFRPKTNPFIKALVFAALLAFLGEVFFQWLGLYDPKGWKHIYSFLIYFLLYLFGYYISKRSHFTDLA